MLQFGVALRELLFEGEDKRNVQFGKDQGEYKGMRREREA